MAETTCSRDEEKSVSAKRGGKESQSSENHLIKKLILQTPPGELQSVLEECKVAFGDAKMPSNEFLIEVCREHNEQMMQPVTYVCPIDYRSSEISSFASTTAKGGDASFTVAEDANRCPSKSHSSGLYETKKIGLIAVEGRVDSLSGTSAHVYFDPTSKRFFLVDHCRQKASLYEPDGPYSFGLPLTLNLSPFHENYRQQLETAFGCYAQKHFGASDDTRLNTSTVKSLRFTCGWAVYGSASDEQHEKSPSADCDDPDDGQRLLSALKLTCLLSVRNLKLHNFWTGLWNSRWEVSFKAPTIHFEKESSSTATADPSDLLVFCQGEITAHVHSFEDANTHLKHRSKHIESFPLPDDAVKRFGQTVCEVVCRYENALQKQLHKLYQSSGVDRYPEGSGGLCLPNNRESAAGSVPSSSFPDVLRRLRRIRTVNKQTFNWGDVRHLQQLASDIQEKQISAGAQREDVPLTD